MMAVIIKELGALSNVSWQVQVSLGTMKEIHTLTDPYTDVEEDSLTWLVERHSELDPFDTQRASGVGSSLVSYRQSLVKQLCLHEIVGQDQREGLVLIVEAAGSGSTFHKIHWEVIEQDEMLGHIVLCRRIHNAGDGSHVHNQGILAERQFYNILMISSRPGVNQDLPYTLLSRPLIELTEKLRQQNGTPVKLMIIRPGCWQAFQNHLEETTRKNGPGYYDLVHFDVHGYELNHIVHLQFNPNKVVNQPSAGLISAQAVAECLHGHGITTVVTNACRSARVGPSLSSSFSEILVRSGIQQVVAMSFNLTAAAATKFVNSFYWYLLAEGSSFIAAAAAARKVLATDRRRLGGLASVEVDDYIVPVAYSSKDVTSIDQPFLCGRPIEWKEEEKHHSEYSIALRVALWTRSIIFSVFLDNSNLFIPDLKGRDVDILRLETQLLSPSMVSTELPQFRRSAVMLVHGAAGVGKSAFVRHLCWWWKATQLVQDSFYVDVNGGYYKNTVSSLLQLVALRFRMQRDPSELTGDLFEPRNEPGYLIVLDSLDSGTQATQAEFVRWSEEERMQLQDLVKACSRTNIILLLVSRSKEPWLGISDSQRYRLGGLPLAYARELVIARLPAQLQASLSRVNHTVEFLDRLICLLDSNPTTLDLLLHDLRTSAASPEQMVNAIQGDVREIFSVYGFVTGCNPSWTSYYVMNTVECAYERLARLNPDLEVALLSLAFFSTRFRLDWFDYIFGRPGSAIRHFLANDATAKGISEDLLVALPAGWIEVDPDYPTNDYPATQRRCTYWKIHPLLTRLIRVRITKYNRKQNAEWPDFVLGPVVLMQLHSYFEKRTYEWSSNSPTAWRQLVHDVTAENANFIMSVDIGLQYIRMPNDSEIKATYRVLIRLAAFCIMMNVDKELIISRCERFVQAFGTSEGVEVEQIGLPRLEFVLQMLHSLCLHYADSFPEIAKKHSEMMLNLFNASNEHARADTTVFGLKCQAELIKGKTLLLLGYRSEGKVMLTSLLEKLIADDTLPLVVRSITKQRCVLTLLSMSIPPLESELRIWKQQLKETFEEQESASHPPAYDKVTKKLLQEMIGRLCPDSCVRLSRDPRKTFDNSRFMDHGLLSVVPDDEIVQTLLKDSKFGEAKGHLLERLAYSIAKCDKPAQIQYYRRLIHFAVYAGSDAEAADYIERLVLLEDGTAGFCGREDRATTMVRYSHYGLCLIRLRRFDAAGPILLKAFGNPDMVLRAVNAGRLWDLGEHLQSILMASLLAPRPGTLSLEDWITSELANAAISIRDAVYAWRFDPNAVDWFGALLEPLREFRSLTTDEKKVLFRGCLSFELSRGTLTKEKYLELSKAMIDWCN